VLNLAKKKGLDKWVILLQSNQRQQYWKC
jgi:hypothetical protein